MKALLAFVFASSIAFAAPRADTPPELPADLTRVERVPVVVRVRLITEGAGSKYLWAQVELVAVFKNESKHTFAKRFSVAHYSTEPGIPQGVSTLYLERYNPQRDALWKLLDGSGTSGVSHTTEP